MTTVDLRDPQRLLTIRERRTLGGPDGAELQRTVDCPRRESSVEVHDCAHCSFGEVVWLDGKARPQVRCAHPRRPLLEALPVSIDAHALAKSVMSPNIACVREDASLEAIAALFLQDGLTAVPVIDSDGRPIGMVSKTDLLREMRDREPITDRAMPPELRQNGFHVDAGASITAGDIMTPLVFAVLENATVAQAIPLMTFEGVHHAPVVSADGRVVGVLSSMDVLRWLAGSLRTSAAPASDR